MTKRTGIGESTRIVSDKEMEAYQFHLSVLTDIIKLPNKNEELDALDSALEYLVSAKLNNRDILNLMSINDRDKVGNNKDEDTRVGINAILNIYHFMNVFKTVI
jgi:hypothetical protein